MPDLRGTWFGTVTVEGLAVDGELTGFPVGEPQPCVVVIERDLRKINVELHSPVSESRSEIGTLRLRGNEVTMIYFYKCERRPAVIGFGLHEGACTLKHRLAPKPEGREARLKSLATAFETRGRVATIDRGWSARTLQTEPLIRRSTVAIWTCRGGH